MNKQTKRYINNLHQDSRKMKYLLDRGLTIESIKKFGIGLSLCKNQEVHYLLVEKNININNGLLQKNGNNLYPFFANRIMIPFRSIENMRVIGFTARDIHSIDREYLAEQEIKKRDYLKIKNIDLAKYKNSMESKNFKKNEYLYNLNGVVSSSAIIFESQLNAIACDQLQRQGVSFEVEGVHTAPHPIATGGTSLTEKHIDVLLGRGIRNITLCFDGDRAGIRATKRAIEMLLKRKEIISVSVISMPKNTDLMDLIRTPKKIKNLVSKIRFAEQWLCDFYEYQERAFDKKNKSMKVFIDWWTNSQKHNKYNLLREFELTVGAINIELSPVVGGSTFHAFLNKSL